MKRVIEEPDMILLDDESYDRLMFTLRGKDLFIQCHIDGTGNEWTVPIKDFIKMLQESK